jgi:hypothetical protein
MMKHFYSLFIAFLLLVSFHAQAQCSWTTVGTGAASTVTNTAYNDIALSSADVPYIAYTDASLSSAVVVKTYSAGAWQAVGSLSTYTNSAYTSIAMDGTMPYVAFSDGTNGKRLLVRKYSAGAWSTVGAAITTSTANFVSLAVHNGTPYVAYVDVSNASRATVKTFSAGAWVAVGAAVSTSTASYTSLSIDDSGTPYIIYQDVANSSLATVKRYNGTAWVAVGTGTVSTNSITEACIDVSYNNTPYIAYTSGANIGTIKTFTAGAWQSVGTGTVGSVYQALALAVDPAGTPYLGYYELGSYKTSVSKYNGTAWVYAGNNYFSLNSPNAHSLAITKTGTPYIVIGDASSGSYVKKLGSPTIIILQPTPTTVCAGTNTQLSIATNTTGVTYQWQVSLGANYANTVNGSTYTGVTTGSLNILAPGVALSGNLYRCIVNDNCTNLISNTVTLTVNPLPPVAATSATICAGTLKAISATGAATYSWSTGNTTATIVVSPTTTTTYTVTGTNAFACSAIAVSTVTTIFSKNISGNVTSSAGAVSGNMILYRYRPVLGKWDSVAFTPFSSIFSFGPVDSSLYVIKAVPTATNVMVTYGSSAISWKGATTVSHGCTNNATQNINILALSNIGNGPGLMSGKIVEGQGFGQRPSSPYSPLAPGQPIKGVIVKGGKNPGGSMFAQTVTAADGTYTLSGLPNNNTGESYFLLVDIPGLDTNQTYHKILNVGNNQFGNLDFVVDSARINPTPVVLGVNQMNEAAYELAVFPNPANNKVTIRYTLQHASTVSMDVTDILGQTVKTILTNKQQLPGRYDHPEIISDLKPGLYFIKANMNGSEHITKFLITN